MSKWSLLALFLGVLLVAAPFTRSVLADEYEDDEEEGGEPAAGGDDEEKDVVVLTTKNFDSVLKGSKFALVRGGDGLPPGWWCRCTLCV